MSIVVSGFLVCLGLYATAMLTFLTWAAFGTFPNAMVGYLAAHERRGR